MANNTLSIALVALLVAGSVLAFAPTASSQGGTELTRATTTAVVITPVSTPIRPLSGFVTIPVTVQYTYIPTTSVAFTTTKIALTVEVQQGWTIVTVTPANLFAPIRTQSVGGQAISETLAANLLVSTTADAPAFTPGNIKVTAAANANGELLASSGEDQTTVQADFFSILDATTPTTIAKAGPQQQVIFPIKVTNFGNAQTKIFFDIDSKPETWQVIMPSPVILESRQQGGKATSKDANVVVQTPWRNGYLNEVGAVAVKITSNYALDTKFPGDRTALSTLTTVIGFYVPGYDPLLVVFGLGFVALAFKYCPRRR